MTKKIRLGIITSSGFLFLLDRVLKYFALNQSTPRSILSDMIGWQPTLNTAGVFSLPINNFWLVIISIPLIALLLFWINSIKNNNDNILSPTVLLLLGALSNFYDRLFYGGVVDYLYILWGAINLADILIVAGAIFYIFTFKRRDHVFKT